MRRLYDRTDEWPSGRSRGQYAFLLGASSGVIVLVVGLLSSEELRVVQSVTLAVVPFALEYAFGLDQTTEE